MSRHYLVTLPERVLHMLNAFCFTGLAWTGFEIRFGEALPGLSSMETAVRWHNALGVALTASVVLWLLYSAATARIRLFLPGADDSLAATARQARYYLVGIFSGAPYPFAPTPTRKFNALQKATYLVLMFGIVPALIATGVYLLLSIRRWTEFDSGALLTWSHAHVAAAFLGTAFLAMHVYMATTGPRPLGSFRTILTGFHDGE
jgi:thiosulfate reductase cytochrome b subunit